MAAIVVALTQPLRLCPARLGPLLGPLLREAARGWRGLGGSEVPGGGGGAAGPAVLGCPQRCPQPAGERREEVQRVVSLEVGSSCSFETVARKTVNFI